MKKLDNDLFEALGQMNAAEDDVAPPPLPKDLKPQKVKPRWKPKLNPGAQQEVFKDKTRNLLVWAEKGSGKTWVILEKMVDHCVTWKYAQAFVVVRVRTQAEKGGSWSKLVEMILPEWAKNRNLRYQIKEDRQHNPVVWLINDHGLWSNITLLSYPHSNQLRSKAPGLEPSFVFVDELTECDTDAYYEAFSAQLGRRPGIPWNEQQYVAACNPAGPSHWVYKKWFQDCVDDDTGEHDPDFKQIYMPAAENKEVSADYFRGLRKTYKKKAIELARLVGGEWIDMPSGDAHFGDIYSPAIHVRPLLDNGMPDLNNRCMPLPGYPVILGIDSGSTHHAFSFCQYAPIDGRMKYFYFDEVVVIKKKVPYSRLIPVVMRRLQFWNRHVGKLRVVALSDDSAMRVYRPGEGTFDKADMEKHWNLRAAEFELEPLRIKPAPKFNGSVKARLACMRNALASEEILINSTCVNTQKMLLMLESEKQKDGGEFDPELADTVKRSDHIHIWDAASYILLTGALRPTLLTPESTSQSLIKVA